MTLLIVEVMGKHSEVLHSSKYIILCFLVLTLIEVIAHFQIAEFDMLSFKDSVSLVYVN